MAQRATSLGPKTSLFLVFSGVSFFSFAVFALGTKKSFSREKKRAFLFICQCFFVSP